MTDEQENKYPWKDLLKKRRVIHHLLLMIPGGVAYLLLPMFLSAEPILLAVLWRTCAIYVIIVFLLMVNG